MATTLPSRPAAPRFSRPAATMPEARRAAGLNMAKASDARSKIPTSTINPASDNSSPRSDIVADAQERLQSKGLRNPPEMQRALQLAKQIGHGRRDKSKSVLAQGLGEAGAQGGRLLGGTIGSAVPIVGSTAGAVIGKRLGRVAGENWKVTLIATMIGILLAILPYLVMIFVVIICVLAVAEQLGLL